MKTADLIRKNQQAQSELVQLKAEIEQFTKSVLSNPENQVLLNYHLFTQGKHLIHLRKNLGQMQSMWF